LLNSGQLLGKASDETRKQFPDCSLPLRFNYFLYRYQENLWIFVGYFQRIIIALYSHKSLFLIGTYEGLNRERTLTDPERLKTCMIIFKEHQLNCRLINQTAIYRTLILKDVNMSLQIFLFLHPTD
jgi:hypothetical protein